jgi:hypothetical protein
VEDFSNLFLRANTSRVLVMGVWDQHVRRMGDQRFRRAGFDAGARGAGAPEEHGGRNIPRLLRSRDE